MEEKIKKTELTKKKKNPFIEIIFNIAIPSLILMKLSTPERLGEVNALILALSFPILYGLYELVIKKEFSWLALLGLVSVFLTGGLGLLKVDGIWFAVKEAAIPSIIGLAVIISVKYKPLIKIMIYNENIMDVNKVNKALEEKASQKDFDKLLNNTNYLLAFSFFLSAVLNFALAVAILKSPAGTPEFNQELGKMNALSFPVIMLPCMVVMIFTMWKLVSGIKKLTGLDFEEVLKK